MTDWVITDQFTVGTYTQFFGQDKPSDPMLGDTWHPINNWTNERECWYWSGKYWLSKLHEIKQELPTLTGNFSLFLDWFDQPIFLENYSYYSLLRSTSGVLEVKIGGVYQNKMKISKGLCVGSESLVLIDKQMPLTVKLLGKGQGLFKFNYRLIG